MKEATTHRITSVRDFIEVYVGLSRKMRKKQDGWNFISPDELILTHGRSFTIAPLPKGIRYGRLGECFKNASRLALYHNDLTYCEGYAMGIIPVLHAFCIDAKGNVVDNTWRDGRSISGCRSNRNT